MPFEEVLTIKYELVVIISLQLITNFIFFFKKHEVCRFNQLSDLTAVDYPERDNRFEIIYILLAMGYNQRLRIKTYIGESQAVHSISDALLSSNWAEREMWDMFGIFIYLHPDLRKILTDYGFDTFPLRKDFPTIGYFDLRYSDFKKIVIKSSFKVSRMSFKPNRFKSIFNVPRRSFSSSGLPDLLNGIDVETGSMLVIVVFCIVGIAYFQYEKYVKPKASGVKPEKPEDLPEDVTNALPEKLPENFTEIYFTEIFFFILFIYFLIFCYWLGYPYTKLFILDAWAKIKKKIIPILSSMAFVRSDFDFILEPLNFKKMMKPPDYVLRAQEISKNKKKLL
jgi:NADH-quinone oxidoreductase subunit C